MMSIVEYFDYPDRTQEKEHFMDLILIALADGIIDDTEMLKGLMFMVAGRRNIVEDEKRGFKSYEALWMRLQTGLVPSGMFNSLCDIVDVDKHLESLGSDFPRILSQHLSRVFSNYGLKRKFKDNLPNFSSQSTLKAVVMENAYMCDNVEADNHE